MKKMKKIMAAAIAMMTFSTAAAVTGTVAWFTASNVVSASGMSLQADTEQGINISNEAKSEWKNSATASHNGKVGENQAAFIPTTTSNATEWKHGNSNDRNSHEANATLDTLELTTSGDGIYKVSTATSSLYNKNVYLLNNFYLRSSTPMQLTNKPLYVNSVVAERSGTAQELDNAFRVLVKYDTTCLIYAPFEAAVDPATTAENGAIAPGAGSLNKLIASSVTIPAASDSIDDDALEISVYCYYEGEDSHCKSANIVPDFNTLSVTCRFGTETVTA